MPESPEVEYLSAKGHKLHRWSSFTEGKARMPSGGYPRGAGHGTLCPPRATKDDLTQMNDHRDSGQRSGIESA
jgi:hypothetical protein